VNDFISGKYPAAVCNKCIADGIGLTNDTAHPAQITGALATTSDFEQQDGACSICKNDKKVIRALRSAAQTGRLSEQSYDVLDRYTKAALHRLARGETDVDGAHGNLMHPLTAWDRGNKQEFVPYMKLQLREWGLPNA
jgi:hypothetical protein